MSDSSSGLRAQAMAPLVQTGSSKTEDDPKYLQEHYRKYATQINWTSYSQKPDFLTVVKVILIFTTHISTHPDIIQ